MSISSNGLVSIDTNVADKSLAITTDALTTDAISTAYGSGTAISVSQPYWSSVSLNFDVETLKRGCEANQFNLTNSGGITKFGQMVVDELNSYVGDTLRKEYSMGRYDLYTADNRLVMSFMYGYVYPFGSKDAPLYVSAEDHVMSVIQIGKEIIDHYHKLADMMEQVQSKISILGSFSR